jgi:hypothetical protein
MWVVFSSRPLHSWWFPPSSAPSSIKATSINGIPINANPFSFPDATLNASGPVTVNVQAQFIPVGTVPKVIVMLEIGPDQDVNCSPLAGSCSNRLAALPSHFQPVARVVL